MFEQLFGNHNKKPTTVLIPPNNSYSDPIDGMNNSGYRIVFTHVATNLKTSFKAFITSWEDSYKQDWKPHDSVGRMDSIQLYQKTSRQLTFSIDIPSFGYQEAARNFDAIQKLIQMNYPVFEELIVSTNNTNTSTSSGGAAAAASDDATLDITGEQARRKNKIVASRMTSPPFFNIKFANWAVNSDDTSTESNSSKTSLLTGVYGKIDGVKFTPDFSENSGFYGNNTLGIDASKSNTSHLVPKLMKLTINMTVLNVEKLGFDSDLIDIPEPQRQPNFPYSANQVYQSTLNKARNEKQPIIKPPASETQDGKISLNKVVGDFFNSVASGIKAADTGYNAANPSKSQNTIGQQIAGFAGTGF